MCPSTDGTCTTNLVVGTYGEQVSGQRYCPHVGNMQRNYSCRSAADINEHVQTKHSELKQVVRVLRDPTPRMELGWDMEHRIDE